jgi:hypothetical protein
MAGNAGSITESVLPPYTFNYRNLSPETVKSILAEHGGGAVSFEEIKTPQAGQAVMAAFTKAGGVFTPVRMPVRSLREFPLTIAEGGAVLCAAPTSIDFKSAEFNAEYNDYHAARTPSQLQYYKEVEDAAREALGPENVAHLWCSGHLMRISNPAASSVGTTAGPIKRVHNDFTEEYGDIIRERYTTHPAKSAVHFRQQLKDLKGLSFTEDEMAGYRVVVLNTWRPIGEGPLLREPLAVCDCRSIDKEDLTKIRTGIGKSDDDPDDDFALEVFLSRHNPAHRWHHVPGFTNQELLIFKTYDSAQTPFIPTMHSAFHLPDEEGVPPRESCEARVIALMKTPVQPSAQPSAQSKL